MRAGRRGFCAGGRRRDAPGRGDDWPVLRVGGDAVEGPETEGLITEQLRARRAGTLPDGCLKRDDKDGQFWIAFDDYVQFFDVTSICYFNKASKNKTLT